MIGRVVTLAYMYYPFRAQNHLLSSKRDFTGGFYQVPQFIEKDINAQRPVDFFRGKVWISSLVCSLQNLQLWRLQPYPTSTSIPSAFHFALNNRSLLSPLSLSHPSRPQGTNSQCSTRKPSFPVSDLSLPLPRADRLSILLCLAPFQNQQLHISEEQGVRGFSLFARVWQRLVSQPLEQDWQSMLLHGAEMSWKCNHFSRTLPIYENIQVDKQHK